jgi:hypothetical protein
MLLYGNHSFKILSENFIDFPQSDFHWFSTKVITSLFKTCDFHWFSTKSWTKFWWRRVRTNVRKRKHRIWPIGRSSTMFVCIFGIIKGSSWWMYDDMIFYRFL